MPNTLGNYNETFFAQEALTQLEQALGLANRIHRDYDDNPQQKGATIQIRRPSTFSAQDEPGTAQDLNTDSLSVTLDTWKGVRFGLTDKELTLSSERIVTDHIRPAAYELARYIDSDLQSFVTRVPWVTQQAAAAFDLADLTSPRKVLFDNGIDTKAGGVSMQIDSATEAAILGKLGGTSMFGAGVDGARINGSIATLYGMDIFANQNSPTFTTTAMADVAGTVVGVHAKGVTAIAVTALTFSATNGVVKGDTFSIAGQTQRYTVTANASTDGAGATTLNIEPALKVALAGGEVVTIDKRTGGAKSTSLAFHKNFACLAMAPLSTLGQEFGGVRMSTASDPKTALSLRTRMWYDANNSKVMVALDCLWGKAILDHNMACRHYSY